MRARLFLSLLVALAPATAVAQHAASGAHLPGLHGGVVEDLGPYHAEVVAKDGEIQAYLFDGKMRVVKTDGAKAKATVQAAGKATSVDLAPAAPNLLTGKGAFQAGKGTKVLIFLTMPGEKTVQGRFAVAD